MNAAEGLTAEAVKDVAERLGLPSVDLEAVRTSYARLLKEQISDTRPTCTHSGRVICFSHKRVQQEAFESLKEEERLTALAIQNALALAGATVNPGRTRDSTREGSREKSFSGQTGRQRTGKGKIGFR